MANTFQLKRSAVQGRVPTTSDLELGELALNTYHGKLYAKKDDGSESIVEIGGGELDGPYSGNVVAVAALDIDCSTGNYFTKTISANSTFTFSNAPSGRAYSFTLEVDHNGGTISWPASVKWSSDTAPTLTTGNTHVFIFVTDDGGSRWRGVAAVDFVD